MGASLHFSENPLIKHNRVHLPQLLPQMEASFMPDLFSDPPYILLILGFALLFAAVVSMCTGKTFYRGLVYRAKDPSEF
jgi:hypothetical protein